MPHLHARRTPSGRAARKVRAGALPSLGGCALAAARDQDPAGDRRFLDFTGSTLEVIDALMLAARRGVSRCKMLVDGVGTGTIAPLLVGGNFRRQGSSYVPMRHWAHWGSAVPSLVAPAHASSQMRGRGRWPGSVVASACSDETSTIRDHQALSCHDWTCGSWITRTAWWLRRA